MILQKKNVKDQMLVRVNFVLTKNDVDLEREFFKKGKDSYETSVLIEEIHVLGFMIRKNTDRPKTARQTLYDFEGLDDGRLISEKEVIRQLKNKRKEIQENYRSY